MLPFEKEIVKIIRKRIKEERRFIKIVRGPRQAGKTTAVTQALLDTDIPYLSVEATKNDAGVYWLKAVWYRARSLVAKNIARLLIIDEVQYIHNWSAVVKTLWDEDTRSGLDLRIILTGSSSLLIQKGLRWGRYELIESTHWSFTDCREAFGMSLDNFLYFGSYPGAIPLINDEKRWLKYVNDSIVEPSITNDVLLLSDVRKSELMGKLLLLARHIPQRKFLIVNYLDNLMTGETPLQ